MSGGDIAYPCLMVKMAGHNQFPPKIKLDDFLTNLKGHNCRIPWQEAG